LSLLNELKRRNVLRVGAAYVVAAWLIIQVVETIFPVYGLSDGAIRLVVTLLAIGLLLVVILAWAFELRPEGLKKDSEVDRSQSITTHTGKKLDRMIMVVLALALGYFAFDKFVLDPQREAQLQAQTVVEVEEARKEGRTEALVESYGDKSIAVLPFVNMSDDASNEYFSDGLSEEMLNLLAKIPELRVTSRSSVFAFKGEKIDIPVVAKKLGVAHILEGSVRKAGNQVRITAQLIEARSDTHLWSETYGRSLDDIFAIQDEIAAAVVAQLKIALLGAPPMVKETDPRAYALYLQGRHLRQQRTVAGYEQAETLLGQALAIDPDYAAALVELGRVYDNQLNNGLRSIAEGLALEREAVNKALAIEPDNALALARLGRIAIAYDRDLGDAARYLEHALRLEPANTDIIGSAAGLTASLGRLDDAIALAEILTSRDPVNPMVHYNLGRYYTSAGQWAKAIASFGTALVLSPELVGGQYQIGVPLLLKGEPQAALEAMQRETSNWGPIGLPMAYHALGRKEESDAALAELIAQLEQSAAYNIAYVLAYRGEADRAFEWLAKAVDYQDGGLAQIIYERLFTRIHGDPRWLPFLESIGRSPEQLAAIKFEVTLPQ
jgi:TolB-like protein/lipoprotein NlpI